MGWVCVGGGLASWLIKDVLWVHLSDAQCRECHALCAMGGWVLAGWVGGVGTRVVVGWVEWVCGGREGGGLASWLIKDVLWVQLSVAQC